MPSPYRIASLLALAGCVLSAAADDLVPYWGHYVLDTTGEVPGPSQPRFDKDDHLKIAYRGHYDIKYVEFADGSFTTQVADTGTGGEAKLDLALDPDGNPHIGFYNDNYTEMHYAWKSGGQWKRKSVTKLHDANYNLDWYQMCMAPDSKGGVHLAYSREYAQFPAMWHTYIDKDGNLSDSGFVLQDLTGKWNDMVLDKDEKPVIAYFRNSGEQLRVSWQESGVWKNQVVGDSFATPAKGFHAAIARVNDSVYDLVYQNRERHEIWMATGTLGGVWTPERIDSLPGFSFFPSQDAIMIGKGGRPYVVYGRLTSDDATVVTSGSLVFAYKDGDTWTKTVIDTVGVTGLYAALAVDSKGMPAITYMELGKRRIKLALGSTTPVSIRPSRPAHGPARVPARATVGYFRDALGRTAIEGRRASAPTSLFAPR